MAIPVQNIYYLLCYAWDEFSPREIVSTAAEDFPDTLHLFSHLLVLGVRNLYRRGLEAGYKTTHEPTSTVRGRILMTETILLLATRPSKLACAFDEMTSDIPTNQILKATLKRLSGEKQLGSGLRGEVRQTLSLLGGIRDVNLSDRLFHEIHLHQNNRMYSFLMTVCRFLYESTEAQEQQGQYKFRDVCKDQRRMRKIFEKFVRNFYIRRQSVFKVKSDGMKWTATARPGSDLVFLPQMRTDATLRAPHRTIVIECKYTDKLFQRWFSSDKFRSGHLYQLSTYLRNMEGSTAPDNAAEGILLYPTVSGLHLDQSYNLQGHLVRIRTLNLNQAWQSIEHELLALVG